MFEYILQIMKFSFPEAIIIILLASSLTGLKFKREQIIYVCIIGFLVSFSAVFFRALIHIYIVNCIIYIGLVVLFLSLFNLLKDVFERTVTVTIASCLYLMLERTNLLIFDIGFGIKPAALLENPVLMYTSFLSLNILSIIIVYIIYKFKLYIFGEKNKNV